MHEVRKNLRKIRKTMTEALKRYPCGMLQAWFPRKRLQSETKWKKPPVRTWNSESALERNMGERQGPREEELWQWRQHNMQELPEAGSKRCLLGQGRGAMNFGAPAGRGSNWIVCHSVHRPVSYKLNSVNALQRPRRSLELCSNLHILGGTIQNMTVRD